MGSVEWGEVGGLSDSCAFLVLNTVFSTSLYASSCGEVRWAQQPGPAIPLHQAGQGPVDGALQRHGADQDSGDVRQARAQWTGQAVSLRVLG